MLSWLRSVLFAIIFYGVSVPLIIVTFVAAFFSHRTTWWMAKVWSRFYYFCARVILGIKVKWEGEVSDEPRLYVFKHESMFETIDMMRKFDSPILVAKQELMKIPLWGYIARKHGMISIDRSGGAGAMRQMIRKAREAVGEGRPIIIFPEGSRAKRGEWRDLRSGFAGLYKLLDLPIVPVAVDSGRVAPRDKFVWHPGTVTYQVQEEIPTGLSNEEVRARVHAAINVLNDPPSVVPAAEIGSGVVLPLGKDAATDGSGSGKKVE